eukprot:scaffold8114_cov126-Cylindrotheca_fusiformis.AAC.14
MHLLKRLLIFESLLVLAVCREAFVTQLRLSQSINHFGHKEREEDEPKYVLMAKTVEGMETAAHAGIRASRRLEDAVPPDEEDNKSAKDDEKSADGGDGSSSDSADAKDKAVSGKATSSGSKKRNEGSGKSKSHEPHVAKKSDESGDKEGTEEQSGDDTSKPKVETTGQQEGGSTGASSSKDIKPKKTKVPKPAKVSKKASKKSNAEDIAAAEKAGSGSSDPEAAEVKNGDAPGSTDSNSQEEGSEEQNGDAAGASNSNSRDGHSVEDGKEEDSSPLDALDTLEKISFNSCQKIDFAVAYLTSLQFDGSFVASAKTDESNVEFWSDVQYFQLMIIPASLLLAFFGSYLLFPASLLTAIGFGVFLVFHFVNGYFDGTLNCQVKLFLSVFSAGICATMAAKFVKFGLFTLGAVSTGIACYMFFDAFPAFDPGQNEFNGASATQADASSLESVMTMSDISPMAWIITIVLSLFTGVCIRVYEQGSVEVLTAAIGGVGTGYSMHSFILLHGGKLNRSLVFFVAGLIGFFGA